MTSKYCTDRRAARGAPGSQLGAVLIVSLIILLMMTIIGVTAMNTNTLEERMAGNSRDRNVAFQAAESALRAGEEWLGDQVTVPEPVTTCSSPSCVWSIFSTTIRDLGAKDHAWWQSNGETPPASQYLPDVGEQPYYVVAEWQYVSDSLAVGIGYPGTGKYLYRVSGRGTGATGIDSNNDGTLDDFFARVLLESGYSRRY